MVVGRKMRFAVLVAAEASVPSRRRRALGAGSQGTVTCSFVRVIVFGRSGCQALVAAMAYIAGQQRRMVAAKCPSLFAVLSLSIQQLSLLVFHTSHGALRRLSLAQSAHAGTCRAGDQRRFFAAREP